MRKTSRIIDWANAGGDHPTIKHLLCKGAKFVDPPLHLITNAFKLDDAELILLLARGIEKPPAGSHAHNMLETAVIKKNIPILRMLLDDGLLAQHLLDEALHKAVLIGSRDAVEVLVAWGADVNSRCNDRDILKQASFEDRPEMINFLIIKGAKIDADNYAGLRTSLLWHNKKNIAMMMRHGAILTDELVNEAFRLTKVPDFVNELRR